MPPEPITSETHASLRPVHWWHSLFVRLAVTFTLISCVLVALVSVLLLYAYGYTLQAYVPPAEIAALQSSVYGQIALIEAFAVIVSALIAFLLTRSFTQPIYQLVEAMRKIAQGGAVTTITTTREDELGRLTQFFNGMLQQVRTTHERDQHVSELKTRFVSVAAHQLRTPLTGMKWAFRHLLEPATGPLTAQQRTVIEQQSHINDHLIKLINQLLSVARIEEGKFVTDFKEIDIVALTEGVISEYDRQAEAKEVTLHFSNQAHEEVTLLADAEHLELVIGNLLDNAIRYSRRGSEVHIMLRSAKNAIQLSVQDHGIGIPSEVQPKIFSRFFRASNAMQMHTDGSGLGLFIARAIVERHGGYLDFASTADATTFVIQLPLQRDRRVKPVSLASFVESL